MIGRLSLVSLWLALCLQGCAGPGLDLNADRAIYESVDRRATAPRAGSVRVALRANGDHRPGWQRVSTSPWHVVIDDRAWTQSVPAMLSQLIGAELERGEYFERVVGPGERSDLVLWIDIHSYYGCWAGGRWNWWWPFKDLGVSGEVSLVATLHDARRDRFQRKVLMARRESRIANYSDAERAAAVHVGQATRAVVAELLSWLDTRVPEEGAKPGGTPGARSETDPKKGKTDG